MRKLIEVYNNNRESVKDSVTIAKEGFIMMPNTLEVVERAMNRE